MKIIHSTFHIPNIAAAIANPWSHAVIYDGCLGWMLQTTDRQASLVIKDKEALYFIQVAKRWTPKPTLP